MPSQPKSAPKIKNLDVASSSRQPQPSSRNVREDTTRKLSSSRVASKRSKEKALSFRAGGQTHKRIPPPAALARVAEEAEAPVSTDISEQTTGASARTPEQALPAASTHTPEPAGLDASAHAPEPTGPATNAHAPAISELPVAFGAEPKEGKYGELHDVALSKFLSTLLRHKAKIVSALPI